MHLLNDDKIEYAAFVCAILYIHFNGAKMPQRSFWFWFTCLCKCSCLYTVLIDCIDCKHFTCVHWFYFQTQALALTRPKSELVLSLQNDSSSTSVSGSGKESYERQVRPNIPTYCSLHFIILDSYSHRIIEEGKKDTFNRHSFCRLECWKYHKFVLNLAGFWFCISFVFVFVFRIAITVDNNDSGGGSGRGSEAIYSATGANVTTQ